MKVAARASCECWSEFYNFKWHNGGKALIVQEKYDLLITIELIVDQTSVVFSESAALSSISSGTSTPFILKNLLLL